MSLWGRSVFLRTKAYHSLKLNWLTCVLVSVDKPFHARSEYVICSCRQSINFLNTFAQKTRKLWLINNPYHFRVPPCCELQRLILLLQESDSLSTFYIISGKDGKLSIRFIASAAHVTWCHAERREMIFINLPIITGAVNIPTERLVTRYHVGWIACRWDGMLLKEVAKGCFLQACAR